MATIDLFQIDLSKVNADGITCEYQIGKDFFSSLEQNEINDGKLHATVSVRERAGEIYQFNIHIKGSIVTPCDRCLDDLTLAIDVSDQFRATYIEENISSDYSILLLPKEKRHYNIAWDLYEIIITSLPLERIHPEGKCDNDMINRFSIEED